LQANPAGSLNVAILLIVLVRQKHPAYTNTPLPRFIHDSTCYDTPRLCIGEVLLGRASSPASIDKQGEYGCGALDRETPWRQDLEPSRDGRVMNNPG